MGESSAFQPGDHIRGKIKNWFFLVYNHHGIFGGWTHEDRVKKAVVIERSGEKQGIRESKYSMSEISEYSLYERPRDPEACLRRARSKIGQDGYNVMTENCEHFANWCVRGEETSAQVVGGVTGAWALLRDVVDGTSSMIIRGVRGAVFSGAPPSRFASALPQTASNLDKLVRVANYLSITGIAEELNIGLGIGELASTIGISTGARASHVVYQVATGQDARVVLRSVAESGNSLAPSVSCAQWCGTMAQYLKYPALGLELAGHTYNITKAKDKIHAVACAGGTSLGARLGSSAGMALGANFGPIGAVAGGIIGGFVGSYCGNYFTDKVVKGTRNLFGGVDLSGSLHFSDELPHLDNIIVDFNKGLVVGGCSGKVQAGPFAALSCHDFATALKVEYFNDGEGAFSLDPEDHLAPFGDFQKKVFYPGFLAGTDLGETLFRADVLLKRIMLDLEVPNLRGWQRISHFPRGQKRAVRCWIFPSRMQTKLVKHEKFPNAKCVQVGEVRLAVEARYQLLDPSAPTGLRDDSFTDPNDPALRMAEQCTSRMQQLIELYPILQRLYECYRLVAFCRTLRQCGVTVSYPWVELYGSPIFETPGRFSTLQNEFRQGDTLITMVGGCILASEKIELQIEEVIDNGETMRSMLAQAYGLDGSDVPNCYRLGRQLNEDRTEVDTLKAKFERGEPEIVINLPSPMPQTGPRRVSLPFAHCARECVLCGSGLAVHSAVDGDTVRYQSILGQPLCSRKHELDHRITGPIFRLTAVQKCATCHEAISGSHTTCFSTDAVARDYHPFCVPEEYRHVPRLDEQRTLQSELFLQASASRGSSLSGGLTDTSVGIVLGGTGKRLSQEWEEVRRARLMRFSQAGEDVDLERALRMSVQMAGNERDNIDPSDCGPLGVGGDSFTAVTSDQGLPRMLMMELQEAEEEQVCMALQESLRNTTFSHRCSQDEDKQFQVAIQESLRDFANPNDTDEDEHVRVAMEASLEHDGDISNRFDDDDALNRAIAASLVNTCNEGSDEVDEDKQFQVAIQESLRDFGNPNDMDEDEHVRVALEASLKHDDDISNLFEDDDALNRAVAASLVNTWSKGSDEVDEDVALAIALSLREQ